MTSPTVRAVARQLAAMQCERYEVGVRDPEGRMMTRVWDGGQIMCALPWLRWVNREDNDVYVRPAGESGLVMLDDLTWGAIVAMIHDAIHPAAVVETSKGSYQGWFRLSPGPLPFPEATALARVLVERYGGDPAAIGHPRYGRLAGFTNRKRSHTLPDGQQPYVHLTAAQPGNTAFGALDTLRAAAAQRKAGAQAHRVQRSGPLPPAGELYRRHADRIVQQYSAPDWSRVDYMVLRAIAQETGADAAYLERCLREGSPELEERKRGHVDDYVRRTVDRVMQQRVIG